MTDPLGLINNNGIAPPSSPNSNTNAPVEGPSFKDVLMENLQQVNSMQQDAHKAIEDLQAGRRDDPARVMVATEKADMAFRMLQQVRNKMVDAYNEIKDMRV